MMENESFSFQEVIDILIKRGGLLGISGMSRDERDLEEVSDSNHRANIALKTFVYNLLKEFIKIGILK